MKSINDIFKNDTHLMSNPKVEELIEYCRELEGKLIEVEQGKQFKKEDALAELTRDVYNSINDAEEQDLLHERWPEEFPATDYKEAFKNLKKYFEEFSRDNRFEL